MDRSRPYVVNPARPFSIRFPLLGFSRLIHPDVISGPTRPTSQDLEIYGLTASFQFARLRKEDGLLQAMARQQHYLFSWLELKAGMVVLAIECGVGASVRELTQFADVNVVGMTSNPLLVEDANLYASRAGVQNRVQFIQGTVMHLDTVFPEGKFDAVYCMDGLILRHSAEAYNQVYRVLKPGGRVGSYEWLTTSHLHPDNGHHMTITNNIRQMVASGTPTLPSIQDASNALSNSRFVPILIDDLANRNDSVPWYQPLQEYRRSPSKSLVPYAPWFPFPGDRSTSTRQAIDAGILAIITAGELKIFSPMCLIVATKAYPIDK